MTLLTCMSVGVEASEAFYLAKFLDSAGLNANETRGSNGNFPEQTDDFRKYSRFSAPREFVHNIQIELVSK